MRDRIETVPTAAAVDAHTVRRVGLLKDWRARTRQERREGGVCLRGDESDVVVTGGELVEHAHSLNSRRTREEEDKDARQGHVHPSLHRR